MEQKTILEELLSGSPEEKRRSAKLDSAHKLSARGKYEEASVLFDELLSENPDDTEAAAGKRMNDRRISIDSRINELHSKRKKSSSAKRNGVSLLRSKKVLTAIVIAFIIVCAAVVAAVGIGNYESGLSDLDGEATEFVGQTNCFQWQKAPAVITN